MIIDKLMIDNDRLKIAGITPRILDGRKTCDKSDISGLDFRNPCYIRK